MAETTPLRNTLSRRYSTTRPLGFRGGGVSPGGNLQPPTAGQVAGINPPAPKVEERPPLSQFTADVGRAPSPAATIGTGVAGQVAGKVATGALDRFMKGAAGVNFNDVVGGMAGDMAKPGGGIFNPSTGVETFPLRMAPEVTGTPLPDLGVGTGFEGANAADLAMDLGDGFDAVGDFGGEITSGFGAGEAVDAAFGDIGADAVSGAAEGIPWVGPALRLAQGDVRGAAGSLIGGALGGPIGAVAGGFLGNACFITEAVMAAGGQGDAAPELEVLRQFRDTVLAATPQGQALVQEYESIAPMVMEAVVQRPDAMKIFQSIDAQFINPAVEAINQGDYQKAVQIYAQMISFVTPYALETGEGGGGMMPGGQQQAMQQMGQHAAMVGHSPEMAGVATGDMGMMDDDPTGYDGGPPGTQGQAPMPPNPMAQNPMQQQFARPKPRY